MSVLIYLFCAVIWNSLTMVTASSFHDNFAYHHVVAKGISSSYQHSKMTVKPAFIPLDNKIYIQNFNSYIQEFLNGQDTFLSLARINYNVSKSCKIGMKHYIDGLHNLELWAFEMLDASWKPPSGILQLDVVWPGQYDQCVNISAKVKDVNSTTNSTIYGKYFRLSIKFPVQTPQNVTIPLAPSSMHGLTLGFCLPGNCTETDVDGLANKVFDVIHPVLPPLLKNVTDWISDVYHPSVAFESRPETVVALFFSGFIGIFIILGTLYDYFIYQPYLIGYSSELHDKSAKIPNIEASQSVNESFTDSVRLFGDDANKETLTVIHKLRNIGMFRKVLVAFSLYTNGSNLLKCEVTPDQVLAINGVRVLSMGWVILGHTYFLSIPLSKNFFVIFDWAQRWTFQAVIGGFFAVDSFFFLSGLLVSYHALKDLQKKEGKFNFLRFYFHRFWRLTPAYMLVILMYTGYFQYWSDGPFWPDRSPDHRQCTTNWWKNLLYIQNFWPLTEQCIGWCWYLANDMQFYIISPIILIPLYRKPLIGYVIVGLLLIEQFVFRGFISVHYNLKMNMPQSEQELDWFEYSYQRPYARIAPYLIGIITGYILWKTDRKVHMPKPVVVVGWILSLICVTSVVYGSVEENRGHLNSRTTDAIYNSVCKTVWSLGIAWIVFACNTGYGGIITSFLSSPLWGPLGRLTYCAYLLHPILIYVYVLSQRYLIYFSDANMIYMFLGHWMMTYFVAFIASLAFEAPMAGLERVFLRRSR